ncbi:MAG: hypothetical protein AAF790_11960, partial [Planctomycetota bacterium]
DTSSDDASSDDGGSADGSRLEAKIYSHTRRPFGVRRRGRVEQFAVLLHPTAESTTVRLHAKESPDSPLSGYRAFVQDGDVDRRDPIGASDANGQVRVFPGEAPIQMVFIKSGSQVVAKAPVPAGAIDLIEIPLLDEGVRLQAEAKVSLLREELIDLVARRSILAARIEKLIDEKNAAEARQMLAELDGMPGRAQFEAKLNRVRQQSFSSNPQVQARIEKLFSETAAVLGAFLSTQKVAELRQRLNAL